MATNVKKITKTIGGTEYGLQVESAIRDSEGKIIKDTYTPIGHKHVKADITDFAHTHTVSEITDLQDTLDGKQDKLTAQTAYTAVGDKDTIPVITTNALGQVTSITTVSVDHPAGATSSANVIDSVTDGVVKIHKSIAQTDGAIGTETTHTSDVEVYTKGQADTLLAGKSGTDHKHVIADITDFAETQLSKEQSGTGNVVTDIAVSGHKITYTMGQAQAKFDDGSATVATATDGIISIQPEVAQTNGAITTGNAAVITTYTKDQIDTILTNNVQYLGLVANAAALAALAPKKAGDWARASAEFTYNSETVHIGDILICDNATDKTYDVVHTEVDSNTWRPVQVNGTDIGSGKTLNLTAGTNVSVVNSDGTVTIAATDTTYTGDDTTTSMNGTTISVKDGYVKSVKVDNATAADSATNATNITDGTNTYTAANIKTIEDNATFNYSPDLSWTY